MFDHYDPELANVTDDEWRQIATVHEIGFHTAGHATVTEVTPRTVHREVVEPMVRIEEIAGYRPRIGAWKGGSRFDPGLVGDQTARAYGVRFLVSNWSIERVPLASQARATTDQAEPVTVNGAGGSSSRQCSRSAARRSSSSPRV